ncbi:MAG: copper chaperone PCu(A)C, partial [Alphaproteobacteria bacterium]
VRTGAAYMTVKISGNAADRLVKVTSPDAETVEMHMMAMDGGVARMREVKFIDIKPGADAQLKPGGLHLMMIGLRRPLREGESIKLSLTFELAGLVDVDATVEKAGAPAPRKHSH